MKARILLLAKDPYSLHKLSSNLQQFKQELIQVIFEAKAFAFVQQKLRNLINIDTSFILEERKKLFVKINRINNNVAFYLVNRQEQYALFVIWFLLSKVKLTTCKKIWWVSNGVYNNQQNLICLKALKINNFEY